MEDTTEKSAFNPRGVGLKILKLYKCSVRNAGLSLEESQGLGYKFGNCGCKYGCQTSS